MYIFKLKKESHYNPEIGRYKSFGIEVYEKPSATPTMVISDVFVDFYKAQQFISLCNECQPEPVHLLELCIDFIQ